MNLRSVISGAIAAVLLAANLPAQDPGPLPPFVPPLNPTPTIRIWGNRFMQALAENWERGFRAAHPEIAFENHLVADGTGMPALYTGLADLALFGRDTNVTDNDGFEHTLNYKHLAIELGTGSLDVQGQSPALVVFVHRDNPLARLTLAQLDAIVGPERRRGYPGAIRTWGDLGLTGEWKDRPIALYADDVRSGPALFFQRVVLENSRKFAWEHFTEFHHLKNPDGTLNPSSHQSLEALRADRYGLAISNLAYADERVKPLALAVDAKLPYYEPTRNNLIARTYPLARPILACVNRPPGNPLDPKVSEFLRYILSSAGQRDIERAGGYLPLNADVIEVQLGKLK